MNLGMEQSMSQRMDQRMELEQRLEMKLEHQQTRIQTLQQYLEQEDVMTGLARWADEHDRWVTFDKAGFNFVYAALPYSVAKPVADKCGPGFAHCFHNGEGFYKRGQWRLFVVTDMLPPEFVDFVAIHERGEQLSFANHFWASRLEFAHVKQQDKVRSYARWIDEKYPRKFNDLTQEVLFPILPDDLAEELRAEAPREVDECRHAEDLIQRYGIPTLVLRHIDRYERATQRAMDSIADLVGPTQYEIHERCHNARTLTSYELSKLFAGIMDSRVRGALLSLNPKTVKGLCRVRLNEQLERYFSNVRDGIHSDDTSRMHVQVEQDFDIAYKNALAGKNVVSQFLTAEEKASLEKRGDIHSYAMSA
jgi:hypothetical protein